MSICAPRSWKRSATLRSDAEPGRVTPVTFLEW
jgi:hypothetical protein